MEGLISDGSRNREIWHPEGSHPIGIKERKLGLYYGLTYIGRRKQNEDFILVPSDWEGSNNVIPRCHNVSLPNGYFLFAIADGMGGASAGEVASELAVTAVKEEIVSKFLTDRDFSGDQLKTILKGSILKAQEKIRTAVLNDSSLSGMGTTMVVLIMTKNKYVWANIGDSRLYLITYEGAELLTKDHTYLWQYMDSHRKPPDEEWIGRYSSYLVRAIDGSDYEPDVFPSDKEWEDFPDSACLLLCSDGLISVKDKPYRFPYTDVFRFYDRPKITCQQLVSAAYFGGSTDNISVILIEGPDFHHEMADQNVLPFPPA